MEPHSAMSAPFSGTMGSIYASGQSRMSQRSSRTTFVYRGALQSTLACVGSTWEVCTIPKVACQISSSDSPIQIHRLAAHWLELLCPVIFKDLYRMEWFEQTINSVMMIRLKPILALAWESPFNRLRARVL